MNKLLLSLILALSLLGTICFAHAQTTTDTPAKSPELKALEDEFAILDAQEKILAKKRAMLKTDIGENAQLPSGKIERDSEATFPAGIRYVAFDTLKEVASRICADIPSSKDDPKQKNANAQKSLTRVLVSTTDLRALRDQYLATTQYISQFGERAKRENKNLQDLEKSGRILRDQAMRAAPAALLAFDAIGAIGSGLSGLSRFFMTERKIGKLEDVINVEQVLLAIRSCSSQLTIVDPTVVRVDEPDLAINEVIVFSTRVDELRTTFQRLQIKLATDKEALVRLKAEAAAAKGTVKEQKDAEVKAAQEKIDGLVSALVGPKAVLDAAEIATQALYAIDATTRVSPIVSLARMKLIIKNLDATDNKSTHVLNVKVQHSSGYSQISRTWWRNDRLEFASGFAVSYELSSQDGAIFKSNLFYVVSGWHRLEGDRLNTFLSAVN
jgi:hypothetical protein